MEEIDAVSRLAQPSFDDNFQENLLRISHLSDAAAFVVDSLTEGKGKRPDTSVLL